MRKLLLVLVFGGVAGAQVSKWTPEVSMKLVRIGVVVPSRNGLMAAWTETRAVIDTEKSEMRSQVFLWRGGHVLQMTRDEKGSSEPAFSPDGQFLYFSSARSGKKNVFRIAVDGGEAEQLTDWKGSMGAWHVSPDGKRIAFAGAGEDPDEEKAKKEKRDFHVVDAEPRLHGLWIVSSAGEKQKPQKLVSGDFHAGEFDWAPDSRRIAFEKRPRPEADYERLSDVAEVEVEGGAVTDLASTKGIESQPHYSPDGRYLAFVKSDETRSVIHGRRIALLDRSTGALRLLAATPDEGPQIVGWPDASRLLVSEAFHTRTAVYALPVDGPFANVCVPEHGIARSGEVSGDGTQLGAVVEDPGTPGEAFLLNLRTGDRKRLSSANVSLALPPVTETRRIEWKSKDGTPVEGLLTLPVGYEEGKRYPLVLMIHGGPSGVYAEGFTGNAGVQPVAAFAQDGYAVLRCNIRGSSGYGLKYRAANFKDWGGGDYQDLMAGVDHVIAGGIADADRLAVMGWSYGGYMTSWVISQTTRFKAAIIGAGLTDLWSMWGTNDIPTFMDDYFDGTPADQPELYRDRSALAHAKNVKTPTLFLHGESDHRVPISQAFEYYHTLKRLGVTTKMVSYPRMPHGPSEPKFQQDIMERHLDWVETYVK